MVADPSVARSEERCGVDPAVRLCKVARLRRLARNQPNGRKRSVRETSAEVAYLTGKGTTYVSAAVARMLVSVHKP